MWLGHDGRWQPIRLPRRWTRRSPRLVRVVRIVCRCHLVFGRRAEVICAGSRLAVRVTGVIIAHHPPPVCKYRPGNPHSWRPEPVAFLTRGFAEDAAVTDAQREQAGTAAEKDGDKLPAPVVYRFNSVEALVEGWQTHVAIQRLIHEESARGLQWLHYWVGGTAAVFASLVGSSAVIAWQRMGASTGLAVLSAAIAAAASALAGIAAFLDLGGRAERHRAAAAEYKRVLRSLEATPKFVGSFADIPAPVQDRLTSLEKALSDLDAEAPIPPKHRVKSVLARGRESRSAVKFDGSSDPSPAEVRDSISHQEGGEPGASQQADANS